MIAPKRILVVRTDRMGDLVLSIPAVDAVRAAWPDASVGVLVAAANRELGAMIEGVARVHAWDRRSGGELVAELRAARYDAALVLHNRTAVNRLLARARIPRRVGAATRVGQVWLTARVRQRRAEGRKHEAEYNLDLARALGAPDAVVDVAPPPHLAVPEAARAAAAAELRALGLGSRPFVVLHPGSGGSALDWRTANYGRLAAALAREGVGALVTGGPGEEALVAKTRVAAQDAAKTWIGHAGVAVLAGILARAAAVVAGSTGPLHLAAAVGTPVIGLYCPRFVCLPKRWGPLGPNATALVPPVDRVCDLCLGPACPDYDCMDKIPVERVLAEARRAARAVEAG